MMQRVGRPDGCRRGATLMTVELPASRSFRDPTAPEQVDPFRLVFETAPVGIAIGAPGGEILYVNETMCRLLGRPREEITVGTFVEAAHPDHKLRVRVRLRSLEAGEFETFVRETRFQHPDGTVVNARFHVSATRHPDGSIAYLVAHAEDITETRRTEEALALSEDRFRAASEASLDSLVMMEAVRDDDGTIVDFHITAANDNAAKLFGVPVSALVGKRVSRHFPAGYEEELLRKYATVVETGEPVTAEYPVMHPRVRAAWLREQIVKVDDGVALTSSDISEQKTIELALRESDERFRALLLHAVDVVCIIDAGGFVRYASPAVERVLGYSTEQFCGLHPFELVHPDDLEQVVEQWQTIGGEADSRFTCKARARRADGGYRWMEANFRDLRHDPRIAGYVVHFHDVTDRHAAEEALLHQTLHDGLTGLPNRALLLDRLAHALDRSLRRESGVAVLFLDIDHFKAVNDSIGHAGGDALLREVAQRLRATVRPEDTVARLGGDEFVICCEEVGEPDAAVLMADRVREAFGVPFHPDGHEITVGTSIGVALADADTESPESALRDADTAMYVAKARGRDRAVVYDDALRRRVLDHLDTEAGLRDALARDEFVVHWQPAYDLANDRITSMEALIRWQHAARGLLLPGDFLGAAAIAGLDAPLGTFVLETACAQLAAWIEEGIAPDTIWLNLSPSQLTWTGTAERVRAVLADRGIAPDRVGFDIAEQAIAEIDRARRASAELAELRELGCPIAIDDFGTGHASPLAVRRYGITNVKLDRSLVQTTGEGDPMLPALMSLARMLGVDVLAEGVETAEQLDRIRRAGCGAATGNHLAPATGAVEATARLRADRG
jgi:diguanylate cyclase (GGDEF)-like protein/PAS domain S-box-containing protein